MHRLNEKLRKWFETKSVQACSYPYLPSELIWIALFLVLTDILVVLIGQPPDYWITPSRAESSFPLIKNMLSTSVFLYIAISLVYVAVLWLALNVFTRSIALVLWLVVSIGHLSHSTFWMISELSGVNANITSWQVVTAAVIPALIVGIILAIFLMQPKVEENRKPVRWLVWLRRAFLILWGFILIGTLCFQVIWPQSQGGWQLVEPEHSPGIRADTAIAYDTARGRAILFGGLSDFLGIKSHGGSYLYNNDTWEWDGTDWQKMTPEHIPSPRAYHAMAYDAKRGVILLFGGQDINGNALDDTWIWDGNDWTQVFPKTDPPERRGAQLFYDPQKSKIILAGGFTYPDEEANMYADTWEWDGKNWRLLFSDIKEFDIRNTAVAYDPVQQQTIVYDINKLSIWSDGYWDESFPETQPPSRYATPIASDPISGKTLLFGGTHDGVQLNDTWLLDGGTWVELNPELIPSKRDDHVMFFDPIRNSFILYGGFSGYALGDMWEYVLPED